MLRAFDVAVSLAALIFLSPLFALIAVAVKLASPGPVFYRGPRVGRFGVDFSILKFRTMRSRRSRALAIRESRLLAGSCDAGSSTNCRNS